MGTAPDDPSLPITSKIIDKVKCNVQLPKRPLNDDQIFGQTLRVCQIICYHVSALFDAFDALDVENMFDGLANSFERLVRRFDDVLLFDGNVMFDGQVCQTDSFVHRV